MIGFDCMMSILATIDYIRDDETLLPKVGVVTIAGLGGLLLGHKAGFARKSFYSSVAGLVALSACYPKQSACLLDQVYIRIQKQSKNLFESKSIVVK
jgi:MICOS complex subunit MIC27